MSQLLALIAVHANLCMLLHLDGACEMPDCISFCRNSGVILNQFSVLFELHKLLALLLQWPFFRPAVQFRAFGHQTAENFLLLLNIGGTICSLSRLLLKLFFFLLQEQDQSRVEDLNFWV